MKLKDVKIRIADFKSLLEAASVNINNPRVLIEPKKSSPSYQPGKPTSVLLECSDTKTGGTKSKRPSLCSVTKVNIVSSSVTEPSTP